MTLETCEVAADDVVLAVADHHGAGEVVAACRLQRGLDAFTFLPASLSPAGAPRRLKSTAQAEVLNDAHSHGVEFRCGDEEPLALRLQVREQLRNAGVGSVVEPAVL